MVRGIDILAVRSIAGYTGRILKTYIHRECGDQEMLQAHRCQEDCYRYIQKRYSCAKVRFVRPGSRVLGEG